jgi:putative glutathione S-transferase
LACPWATACFTIIKLKGLEDVISVSVVKAEFGPNGNEDTGGLGWVFGNDDKTELLGWTCEDPLNGNETLKQLYLKATPNYRGRFTVPVFWDKKS